MIDDLAALTDPPDVIHGHHHLDAISAMLWFPEVPAVYVTHGWIPWEELPPVYPNIRRYLAVSETGRERLVTHGVAPERVDTVLNFADMRRFAPRDPLPDSPKRVLVFTNHARDGDGYTTLLRDTCRLLDIRVNVVGAQNGNPVREPEHVLGWKGRTPPHWRADPSTRAPRTDCRRPPGTWPGWPRGSSTGAKPPMLRRRSAGTPPCRASGRGRPNSGWPAPARP